MKCVLLYSDICGHVNDDIPRLASTNQKSLNGTLLHAPPISIPTTSCLLLVLIGSYTAFLINAHIGVSVVGRFYVRSAHSVQKQSSPGTCCPDVSIPAKLQIPAKFSL